MCRVSPVNVFTPSDEISDPARFAGRQDQLDDLAIALESQGAQIVIYGNRGVGKSSLARQLKLLADNDDAVRQRLLVPIRNDFNFHTVFFRCDDSILSIQHLLLRLLKDDNALAPWVPYRILSEQYNAELGGAVNLKVLKISGKLGEGSTVAPQELPMDVVSLFTNTVQALLESKVAENLLIVIDEFDRIKNREGLASLFRTLGPLRVKFALVAVAKNISELIEDHESVSRQLADGSIHMPPMSDEEMKDIFVRAEGLLSGEYEFTDDAKNWIVGVAKGHPYYVHLLGKHSLLLTMRNGQKFITRETSEEAMRQISLRGSAPIQENLYKRAIGHSYTREFILRAFAARPDEEIHTTEVYADISVALSIETGAVSVYVGQLASEAYGPVLEKTRDRYYRFKDSLFKAYAAARPWQLSTGETEFVDI